jgi:hypothetical protein
MTETIKGFKGFDKDLKCRGYQYEVGQYFQEEGKIEACSKGFHFCENPFDVFSYYPPSSENGINRYCVVEGGGSIDKDSDDTKIACSKLHISAEIGLKGLVEAGVKFILDKVNWKDCKESNTGNQSAATNTGDQSAATNTGDQSAATNTGNQSAATNTGDRSAATNTGNYSAATNTGNYSAATNTGYQSAATNTGNRSAATNTGNYSAATNTGDRSAATNTGDQSAAQVSGKDSIAIVTGKDSKAKGSIGCWIVLTERGDWDGNTYPIKEVKAVKVDGGLIKPDTYYKLDNGEIIPCE